MILQLNAKSRDLSMQSIIQSITDNFIDIASGILSLGPISIGVDLKYGVSINFNKDPVLRPFASDDFSFD